MEAEVMAESRDVTLAGERAVASGVAWIGKAWHTAVSFSRRNPLGGASALVLVAIVVVAAAAPLIAPYDPILDADYSQVRAAPSSEHILGTDDIGRDTLSRIIHGARVSLLVAFVAVLMGDIVGAMWGITAGYLGGKFDLYSQRFLELIMSFPTLILAMLLLLGMGAGITTVIIAIAVTRIPVAVRVIRSVALGVKENAYVEAARAIGASNTRIMGLHIAPQCIASWLILVTANLGSVVILEASLGFLGVGIPAPTATWGNLLGGSIVDVFVPKWWLVVFPGVAIMITVLAFNLFGDGIRDALDPKLRGRT
jgi:ABC-type dipeptide/oligopeptide/nickel transport system permease subunit